VIRALRRRRVLPVGIEVEFGIGPRHDQSLEK
jgi:hypothetical protein